MANAIVGSGKLLLLAALIGVPIGLLGGIYLAEFGGKTSCLYRPLHRGSAERRALDRDRHLRLRRRGAAGAPFLHSGGRVCAGRHDDSHRACAARRSSCTGCRARCAKAPWLWARANGRTIATVVLPAASRGIVTAILLAWRAWPAKPRRCCSRLSAIASGAPDGISPLPRLPVMIFTYAWVRMTIGTGRPGRPDWFCSGWCCLSISSSGPYCRGAFPRRGHSYGAAFGKTCFQ